MLIKPKEVTVTDRDGDARTFIISRVPSTDMREIVASYPLTAMPRIGDYKANEEVMFKMLRFVGVPREGGAAPLMLTTKALVDNHTGDWECLAKIEIAMFEYNISFFDKGVALNFLKGITPKLNTLISSTLTGLLGQLLQAAKQHSKS